MMWKWVRIVAAAIGVLGIVAVAGLGWLGAFNRLAVTEETLGPFEFVYRLGTSGDYADVRTITTALEQELGTAGIALKKPLDIFYPDKGTPGEIGFVVSQAEAGRLAHPDPATRRRTIPAQQYMVVRFPYRNPASYLVGFSKVDPLLREYRALRGYAPAWAGSMGDGGTILYLQAVAK